METKKQMLVVNDNAISRQVLKELFDAEFDILEACDGAEALQALWRHASDVAVVLLDILMPNKDGLDVLREMQQYPEMQNIPVIVTSAASDDAIRQKALDLGAVDYIFAPFDPVLARVRVRSTLATREYDRLRLQNEMLRLQQKQQAEYRALLEETHTAVLEFDAAGNALRYDATIKKELAGTYDGRRLSKIFLEDGVARAEDAEKLEALIARAARDPNAASEALDLNLRRQNGQHAWYQLRLLPKIDDVSGEKMLVMSVTNIDRQKREEEATRVQLIHALNAAEEASNAKSAFMSHMSHEVRTPLNAAIGFLDLARASMRDPARMDEYLSKAEFSAKHLLSILNDMLDMSAIEAGHLSISYESYNLKELIGSVTSLIYPQVHRKNQQFQILVDGVVAERVMGDKMRLSQILINLLVNAVKFTPQNGRISLTLRQHMTNANRVTTDFIVKDDGIGMSKEFLDRLGQPFEQQNAEISRRYGGTGLGLSITKNLVALMNGALLVDSAEGRGSTFTVSLPMDVEKQNPVTYKPYEFAAVRALVIDRDEMAAEHTRACFRNVGCACDCAVSGRDALGLCLSNQYTLVLMDWKMPDLDGESIIAAIRQAMDEEPVFVIMAYDHIEVNSKAGQDLRFVSKPIFPSTVLDLLLKLYGKYEVPPVEETPGAFQGKTLLLAEDNVLNMEIACGLLSMMGFRVIPVVNGQEAVEAFENSEPGELDAILMDVQMPLTDGYEATRRIRKCAHPSAKTVPILAMTANAFAQDVADALQCGMNDHIAKPIDVDNLKKTLAKYLPAN